MSPEDICNAALRRIGYPTPIGDLYEGSPASRAALDVYSEIVLARLRAGDHEFSRKVAVLTLSGNAAPLGWTYEYLYPADCVRVRGMPPVTRPNPPMPLLWDVGTSVVSAAQTTVIWAALANASLVYTTNLVTESDWTPLFTEEIVQHLMLALSHLVPSGEKGGGSQQKWEAENAPSLDVGLDS